MGAARVLVVGSTMMDLISYAKVIPNAGETLVGDRFQMGFGGKGANQAVQAARFGAPVAMVNAVGDDAYGASHLANFVRGDRHALDAHRSRLQRRRADLG